MIKKDNVGLQGTNAAFVQAKNRDFENWSLNTGPLHTSSIVGKKQNFKSPWLFQRLINWTILFHSCFSVKSSTPFDDRTQSNSFENIAFNFFFKIRIFFICSIWFNGRVKTVNCIELLSFVREGSKTERSISYARVTGVMESHCFVVKPTPFSKFNLAMRL